MTARGSTSTMARIGDDWKFHAGGFYHYGEGVKKTGLSGENGGQFKANLTWKFDSGFIRLDYKFLDDRSPVYLPVPVEFNRNGVDATYTLIPGFDLKSGALQSPAPNSLLALDRNGNRVTDRADDGYRTVTKAFGDEASFDLGGGFKFDDKFRYAITSGKFVGPYPATVDYAVTRAIHVNAHIDNLFNVVGITEVDQGPGASGFSVGSARSILQRQITVGARFDF